MKPSLTACGFIMQQVDPGKTRGPGQILLKCGRSSVKKNDASCNICNDVVQKCYFMKKSY